MQDKKQIGMDAREAAAIICPLLFTYDRPTQGAILMELFAKLIAQWPVDAQPAIIESFRTTGLDLVEKIALRLRTDFDKRNKPN